MSGFVYDAGVLVAADRSERRVWADHQARLRMGFLPAVPTAVVAQVSRSPRQAQLRRFLAGCDVAPLTENQAHEAGRLLAKTKSSDVIDATLVILAAHREAQILTGDKNDIERLVTASGQDLIVNAI